MYWASNTTLWTVVNVLRQLGILRLLWANFAWRQILWTFVNVLGRKYVELTYWACNTSNAILWTFVNVLGKCAWICHFESVVGKLCMEANFVNVCEHSRQEYSGFNICTQAIHAIQLGEHLWMFLDKCAWIFHFETVVGKLCMEVNFVNICERFKVCGINIC